MSNLTDQQIDYIANKVFHIIKDRKNGIALTSNESKDKSFLGKGIFNSIDEAVTAVSQAQKQLVDMTLNKRDEIIASIRKKMLENVEFLFLQDSL